MIINAHVPLHRLILSLSEAMDYVHPSIADHQLRVAYVALRVGQKLGLAKENLLELFYAGALHDIGLIRQESRIKALQLGKLEEVSWHSEVGYELLRGNPLFARAAEAVRYHHTPWENGRGAEVAGRRVPFAAHILVLSDAVSRLADPQLHILDQADFITKLVTRQADKVLHPDCVDAFRAVSVPPAFWLDCASNRIYSVILDLLDWPSLTVDEETIEPIAAIFAHVVDAASRWTATHTAGVAATAVALAKRLNFSPREILRMRAAGYFHDLGKLTVPGEILDKPGKLTPQEWSVMKGHTYHTFHILNTIGGLPQICEWAAFHHERLDGTGYPFGHGAAQLTLGARIMAVADVFTAISEDRPYRPGMPSDKAMSILDKQVSGGALDGDVVAVLRRDCDAVNETRRQEQAEYSRKQNLLLNMIGELQTAKS